MADTQQQAMGLQLRKEKAEIKVMEAQAENLKAEAQKKGGVDTEKAEWEITNTGIVTGKQIGRAHV